MPGQSHVLKSKDATFPTEPVGMSPDEDRHPEPSPHSHPSLQSLCVETQPEARGEGATDEGEHRG